MAMSQDVSCFLDHYWRDIGTPLSHKLLAHKAEGRWTELVSLLEIQNDRFVNPSRLFKARLAVDIIKKADYLPIDIDRRQAATEKWAAAEKQCRDTNYQLRLVEMNHSKANPLLLKWIPRIRRTLKRYLGEIPSVDDVFGGFGPGATLSNRRSKNSVLYKLQENEPSITENALWFYPALPKRLQTLWPVNNLAVVSAGRLQMVPKNYKTDRPIMVEPLVNASIQRFFGAVLTQRLRRLGVDKTIAPEFHKDYAKEGSLNGNWSTIDLSAASDTVSKELVRLLLPHDWYRLLDNCRTPCVDLQDLYPEYEDIFMNNGIYNDVHVLEKFSSMGNGFTFELETIIFLAICATVAGRKSVAGVYGDDMIVARQYTEEIMEVLTVCGFTINPDKSFWGRPGFRESCGGDYLFGVPVKGITLKEEPATPFDWMDLHNRIWMIQESHLIDFSRTLNWIRGRVPTRDRLPIPARLGGGGFFCHNPKSKIVDDIHYYKIIVPRTRYNAKWDDDFSPDVILAAMLLGGVPTTDGGVTIANVDRLRDNGVLLGPVIKERVPSWKYAWVPCS